MADATTVINPYEFGYNPWVMNMANFANAYSATDPESLYNNCSIFNNNWMGYNPMFMSNRMMNPAAYDAMKNGINPMGSLYFNHGQEFQKYNTQQAILNNGVDALASYAQSDNQDDFKATYNKMLATEKYRLKGLLGKNYSDAELTKAAKANINQAFQNKYQVSLQQALAMHGDSPFVQGMKDALAFGGLFSDKETVSKNIAMVNDAPLNSSQRNREKFAQALGTGVATGALIPGIGIPVAAIKSLKGLKGSDKGIIEFCKEAFKSSKILQKAKSLGKWSLLVAGGVAVGVGIWNWIRK